jgi:glycosyltransferase involved in cell wall biosynthesis
MRIAFINQLAESFGSTIRCRLLVRGLRELGHTVIYSESLPSTLQGESLIEQSDNLSGYYSAIIKRISLLKQSLPLDLVIISKLNPLSLPLILWARWQRIPLMVDWDDLDSFFQSSWSRMMVTRFVERGCAGLPDMITTHNEILLAFALRRGARRASLIPQAIDEILFTPRPEDRVKERKHYLIPDDRAAVGIALTFTQGGARDLEILLSAQASLESRKVPLSFLIAGDGPLRYHFQKMATDQGLSHVHWVGWLAHERIPRFLSALDLGIVLMREDAGNRARFSLKVIEYLAMNIPVMGNLVGATADSFSPFLAQAVKPDSQSLANALETWVREKWKMGIGFGRVLTGSARDMVLENHSVDAMKKALKLCLGAVVGTTG